MSGRGIFVRAASIAFAITCSAAAQPTDAGADVVDPWRAHARPLPHRMLLDLEDPWADETPGMHRTSSDVIDPWYRDHVKTRRAKRALPVIEVVDPWTSDSGRPVPTAGFPIIDPWQAPRTTTKKTDVPTATFPRL